MQLCDCLLVCRQDSSRRLAALEPFRNVPSPCSPSRHAHLAAMAGHGINLWSSSIKTSNWRAVPKCSIEYIPLYLQHNSLNSDFFRSFIWWLKSLDHFRRPSASPWASMRSGRCSVGDNGPSGPATAESTIQLWILNGYPTLKSKITAVSVFQSIFACYIAILYYLIYIYTHHDSILLYIIYIAIMLYSHMIMVR